MPRGISTRAASRSTKHRWKTKANLWSCGAFAMTAMTAALPTTASRSMSSIARRASDWDRAQPSGREEVDMLDMSCWGGWEEFHIGSIEGWDEAARQSPSAAHYPSFTARKYGQRTEAWKLGQKLSCRVEDDVMVRRFKFYDFCSFTKSSCLPAPCETTEKQREVNCVWFNHSITVKAFIVRR